MSRRKTKEEVNHQLTGRNVVLIGDYLHSHKMTEFQCEVGHIFLAKTNRILNGGGCTECSPTKKLTKDVVNERLIISDRPIQLIDDYINNSTKLKFQCSMGHIWYSKTDNVLNGSGCPSCAKRGYNDTEEGHLYLLDVNGICIKYGITNDIKGRQQSLKRLGGRDTSLIRSWHFGTGRKARDVERLVKLKFGGGWAGPEILPNGWTETLDSSLLNDVVKFIEDVVSVPSTVIR